jgi:hypothetical protein
VFWLAANITFHVYRRRGTVCSSRNPGIYTQSNLVMYSYPIEEFLREKQMPLVVENGRLEECRRACAGFESRIEEKKPAVSHAASKLNVPYIFFEPERITHDLNTRETALTKYNLKLDSSDYDYDLRKK